MRTILVSGQLQLRTFLSRPEGVRLQELRLWKALQRKPLKRAKLTYKSRGYPITGVQLPVIGHARDRASIT